VVKACNNALIMDVFPSIAIDFLLPQYSSFTMSDDFHNNMFVVMVVALFTLKTATWTNITPNSLPLSNVFNQTRWSLNLEVQLFAHMLKEPKPRTINRGYEPLIGRHIVSQLTLAGRHSHMLRTGVLRFKTCVSVQQQLLEMMSMYEQTWNQTVSTHKFIGDKSMLTGTDKAVATLRVRANRRQFMVFLACRKNTMACGYTVSCIKDLHRMIYNFL
jgi:hypothetical protein